MIRKSNTEPIKTKVTSLLYRGLLGLVVDFANLHVRVSLFLLGEFNRFCLTGV